MAPLAFGTYIELGYLAASTVLPATDQVAYLEKERRQKRYQRRQWRQIESNSQLESEKETK